MKKLIILAMLAVATPALAWEYQPMQPGQMWQAPSFQPAPAPAMRYNPMGNSWNYEKPDTILKYNPMDKEWSYEAPKSSLRYNPMENSWEYVED